MKIRNFVFKIMSDSNTLSITQMSSVQLEISAKMKTETGVSLG